MIDGIADKEKEIFILVKNLGETSFRYGMEINVKKNPNS